MLVSSAPLRNRPTERGSWAMPPPRTTPRPNCTLLTFSVAEGSTRTGPWAMAADLAVEHLAVDHGHVGQACFQQVTAAKARGLAAVLDPQFHVEMIALLNARPQKAADQHQREIARGQQLVGIFDAPPLHFGNQHCPLRRGFRVAARAVQSGDQADRLKFYGEHAKGDGQIADRMGLIVRRLVGLFRLVGGEKAPRRAAGQQRGLRTEEENTSFHASMHRTLSHCN